MAAPGSPSRLSDTGIWDEQLERLLPEELPPAPEPGAGESEGRDRSADAFKETLRVSREEVLAFLAAQSGAGSGSPTRDGPLLPTIGDRYEVLEPIAEGGMARIYKVRHKGLGREFALKVVQPGGKMADRLREHLLREARMVSRLDHPNIVQVTDFDVDLEWGVFIVMAYLRGETLFSRLQREGRLGVPLALQIALQVAEAVIYMHERRIVHRDLKPENVFLVRPPRQQRQVPQAKIIDFGLSGVDIGVTLRGSSGSVGTPAYMSPEQLRGAAPRPSMDIYALGVMLYEMIVGRAPFVGNLEAVVSGHLNDPPERPSALLGDACDERLEALILRALEKSPADRHSSVAEFAYELRTVMDMLGVERRGRRGRVQKTRAAAPECPDPDAFKPGWLTFQSAPVPLFQVSREGAILALNEASERFFHVRAARWVGRALTETALGRIHPHLAEDIARCVESQVPVQRVLALPTDTPTQVVLSLAPAVDPHSAAEPATVAGAIYPITPHS